jgi:hypothetical protein
VAAAEFGQLTEQTEADVVHVVGGGATRWVAADDEVET